MKLHYPPITLQTPGVIDGHSNLLLGPQVALGGLNRRMPEQKLDLLEVSTGLAAQLMGWSACAVKGV
jgi:hypothetical protein